MRPELLMLALQSITNTAYFDRGQAYHDQKRVQWLDEDKGRILARVQGSRDYTVALWEVDNRIQYNCDCPIGQEGAFCKHCVATALAWLDEMKAPSPAGAKHPKRPSAIEDIRNYLASLEPRALIDLIVNTCLRDDRLREKLLLAARRGGDIRLAIKTWKEALRRATATHGFVDYGEMSGFTNGIGDVLNALQDWISDGHADCVVDLAEYAVRRIEEVIGECDDSNGEMSGLLERITQLHLEACRIARPEPLALAERLFEYELDSEWGAFSEIATEYAAVLGAAGLAHYRQLAEAKWAKIPALKPGSTDSWQSSRYRITGIMEALARQTGDLEALVAVYSRDLSSAWRFLQIAGVYQQAGRSESALEWAERGLKAFPEQTDWRLREFLIEAYLQRERREEALALVWAQFTDRMSLDSFNGLKAIVKRTGEDEPTWRERALTHLRQQIARDFAKRKKAGYGPLSGPEQSQLVEILLSEQDVETAWREANAGTCRNTLWLQLADLRANEYPEDALTIYRRQAAQLVAQTNNAAYEQALVLIEKISPLLQKQVDGAQRWSDYLTDLRSQYKMKRNFMKLLNALQ
jgi:hypothetical protein